MRILLIAPVPPPVTGQSLAVQTLFNKLSEKHQLEIININKSSFKSGVSSLKRISQIYRILIKVLLKRKMKDLIYFTISESFAGNMKDMLIYLICFPNRNKLVIHMLGGAGMKSIVDKNGWQFRLNKFFISRLGAVIVEGAAQAKTFSKMIDSEKIHIVHNFAEDYLFLSEDEIHEKFKNLSPINILFLSNLITGKGYKELVDGYAGLDPDDKKKIKITFVGGFESDSSRDEFLASIKGKDGIKYHGVYVGGSEKREMYSQAHIFCLPTYYPFEGQPISILEGYATGCVVISTDHSGIPEIFTDIKNGFKVEKMSADSIQYVLKRIISNPDLLLPIAISNRKEAHTKYRTSIYSETISEIFENTVTLN